MTGSRSIPSHPTCRRPIWRCIRSAACPPWSMTASRSTRPLPSPATSIAPSPGPTLQPADAQATGAHGPDHRRRRFLRLLADGAAGLLHRVFRPASRPARRRGRDRDGLAAAEKVLGALENCWPARPSWSDPSLSLADLHLGAMIAYFAARRRKAMPRPWRQARGPGGRIFGSGKASQRPIRAFAVNRLRHGRALSTRQRMSMSQSGSRQS